MVLEGLTFEQIQPFILIVIIGIFALGFYKIRSKSKVIETRAKAKAIKESNTIAGGLSEIIDTAGSKIMQIDKELAHLQKTNATEEQMSKLKQEREILVKLDKYGKVIKPISPIADRLLKKFEDYI